MGTPRDWASRLMGRLMEARRGGRYLAEVDDGLATITGRLSELWEEGAIPDAMLQRGLDLVVALKDRLERAVTPSDVRDAILASDELLDLVREAEGLSAQRGRQGR